MTITAQSIIKEVQEQLQDVSGVRWTAIELVDSLNDCQRDIVNTRPDMAAITAALALSAGPKQVVPTACQVLISIPRNTTGAAITPVERRLLDAVNPDWYSMTGATSIKHASREATEPRAFYVYPPAAATGASVDLVYAPVPTDVTAPTGAAYSTVSGNIGVADVFKTALLHFILFRAFSKDAEFGGNTALSGAHFALFTELVKGAH